MNTLTPKQEAFLTARMDLASDAEAAKRAGVALSTVRKWKKDDEFFLTTYKSSVTITEKTRDSLKVAQKATLQGHMQSLIAAMPAVVQEVVRIAQFGDKDSDRIAAIKLIFEATNFKADEAMPISKQNQNLMLVLAMTRPQLEAEAKKRGLPVDVVESTATEIFDTRFNSLPDLSEEDN